MPGMGSDSIPGIFELTSGSTSDTISTGKVSVSGIGISGNGFKSMTAKKPQSHKQLKQEFIEEMRYLSKIRHPCITTVMGKKKLGDYVFK